MKCECEEETGTAWRSLTGSSAHLPAVGDVDDDVSLLLEDPLVKGGQVGGVVGVAPVRLDDGERDGLARAEHQLPAFVQLHQA